jgi:hypothetical protein
MEAAKASQKWVKDLATHLNYVEAILALNIASDSGNVCTVQCSHTREILFKIGSIPSWKFLYKQMSRA